MLAGMSETFPLPRSIRRDTLSASAGQTVFGPFQWRIYDSEDVKVEIAPPGTEIYAEISSADFTVSPVSEAYPTLFSIVLDAPAAENAKVRVAGKRTPARTSNVTQGGVLISVELEKELDTQVATQQELRRDVDQALASALDKEIEFTFSVPDGMASGEVLIRYIVTRPMLFRAGLAKCKAGATQGPLAQAVVSLRRNGAQFATITYAIGMTAPVLACAADTLIAEDDVFTVLAPNPRDDGLLGFTCSLVADIQEA